MPIVLDPPFKTTDSGLVLYVPLWAGELSGSPFYSKDINKHLCTVTGALWAPQGRSFDGTDDYITISGLGSTSFVQNTGIFTIWGWIKFTDYTTAAYQVIIGNTGDATTKGFFFTYANNAAPLNRLEFYASKGVAPVVINSQTQAGVIVDNNWHFVAVTGDGTNCLFYVDLTEYAGTSTMGAKSSGDSSFTSTIGANHNAAAQWLSDLAGIIGDFGANNRKLSAFELQNIYLATKWRYSG